jgi:DNA polymerase-3 subunit alpha
LIRQSFVHLHNHSQYSLLDGASKLEDLLDRAAEDGMPALAVTDHGNLFAAVKFHDMAAARGIKPIIGCEAYVAPGDRRDKVLQAEGTQGAQKKPYYHLVLLARNQAGYANLVKLSSIAYTEGFYYKPRIDKEVLAAHAEGLIGTSACLGGEVAQLLLSGRREEAERAARTYEEILGRGNFHLEIQNHGLPEQRTIGPALVELSRRTGIPLVATNDCHFLTREDHAAHDVLICIQTGKTINDASRMRYTQEHYFKSAEEMAAAFRELPEALRATLEIAEGCEFKLDKQQYHLPRFEVPEGDDLEGYFRKVVKEGFERRLVRWKELQSAGALKAPLEAYQKRLDDEIEMICRMRFPGYFLVVWDFIRYARESGVPVGPGRGSAAGSLVAYCMGITDIDPIPYNLIFERFLNPERVSMPDIDIDFCMRKRGQVIEYVTRKYGRDRVAQIITFGTMAARAVIRDAGRGLDIPYGEVDRIAKMVPVELDATLEKALASVPQLREACDSDAGIRRLLDVARRLEGLTRHASTHAAGVVIAPRAITEFAPLYQAGEGEITTQYAMDSIERIGLLKMDFLGLKTLTLIEDVLDRLEASAGGRIDLERLPLDDAATYALFCEARTSGVFQFESAGMKDILARLKPSRFEDLIALNALYRPGPIKGGLIDEFIKRRHGKVKVSYPHPILEPILRDTYGVIVYQEQVMQIASAMAGYSLGEADILRRAMGKKKKEVMASERSKFVEGARRNKIPAKVAGEVFDLMEHFAGYGFNASHSAAYALIAYRTAYLKAHHPREFMAALLSIEKENTDEVAKYVQECREMGIQVLPPDVNESRGDFAVEGEAIRYGLAAVKKVGEAALASILEGRGRLGRYVSIAQLCAEVDPRLVNKGVVEALVKAGAFDGFGAPRGRLFAAVDGAMEAAGRAVRARASGQESLFGGEDGGGGPVLRDHRPPDAPDWTEAERLAHEREALGFYLTGHPLTDHLDELRGLATHATTELASAAPGAEVVVGGMMTSTARRKTRKGETMATFVLEDLRGGVEVVVFPELYGRSQALFMEEGPVLVTGRVEADESRLRILASDLAALADAQKRRTGSISIRVPVAGLTDEVLERLRGILEGNRGGCPVFLELSRPGTFALTVKAGDAFAAAPSPGMVASVEALLGPGSVRLRARPARPGPGRRPSARVS